jgi:hypothetical protein
MKNVLEQPLTLFTSIPSAFLMLAWGTLNLFYGYKLFRFFLALSGAYLGAKLANQYLPQATFTVHLIIMVVSAVITSVLAFALYSLVFTILGGIAGLLVGLSLIPLTGLVPPLSFLVIVISTLIGIGLGSVFKDFVIVLATTLGGASLILDSLPALLTPVPALRSLVTSPGLQLVLYVVLVLIGLTAQSRHRH